MSLIVTLSWFPYFLFATLSWLPHFLDWKMVEIGCSSHSLGSSRIEAVEGVGDNQKLLQKLLQKLFQKKAYWIQDCRWVLDQWHSWTLVLSPPCCCCCWRLYLELLLSPSCCWWLVVGSMLCICASWESLQVLLLVGSWRMWVGMEGAVLMKEFIAAGEPLTLFGITYLIILVINYV